MLDQAQDVVVVGIGVGPLLHHCGDGVAVGAVGIDLVAHAQQFLGGRAHGGAISGANIGVECGDFVADGSVFVAQGGEILHRDAQFGCRAVC